MTFGLLKNYIDNNVLLSLLAQRIKKVRTQKGLTQLRVFHDTNIHIGRIEQGKRDISFTTLYKLCDYFSISLSEFLKGL